MIKSKVRSETYSQNEPEVKTKPFLKVLIVEDNSADYELVTRELRRAGFRPSAEMVQTPEEFRRHITADRPDIVLADYNLEQWRGIETLGIMRDEGMDIPLILVSGALGDVTAVECIKQGATDYVLKDSLTRLPICINRALKEKQLRVERQRAIDELAEKAKELTRSNQDLEQFAYVASHDLQEPLRMVVSYTQLLAERYRGKFDEQADKYIHYATDGALRMQTLIQDLLAFSRTGRHGTELLPTDCNAALEEALANLQAAVSDSGAVVLHPALPVVMANAAQLRQVFQNLLGNAIKFRGADVPVIQIEAENHGREWVFSMSDNGIGIAPEYADEIFIIFKRLHTRSEYSGNGIGLAICKKIIELCGGRIWAESRQGRGTTFKFTLPAAPQPARERTKEQVHKNENYTAHLVGGR